MVQLLGDDLAQLTAGSGQQVHLRALLRVVRHGRAGRGSLVIRMRVHEQDARVLRIIVIRQQIAAGTGGDALTLRGVAGGRGIRLSVLGIGHRLSLSYAGSGFLDSQQRRAGWRVGATASGALFYLTHSPARCGMFGLFGGGFRQKAKAPPSPLPTGFPERFGRVKQSRRHLPYRR